MSCLVGSTKAQRKFKPDDDVAVNKPVFATKSGVLGKPEKQGKNLVHRLSYQALLPISRLAIYLYLGRRNSHLFLRLFPLALWPSGKAYVSGR